MIVFVIKLVSRNCFSPTINYSVSLPTLIEVNFITRSRQWCISWYNYFLFPDYTSAAHSFLPLLELSSIKYVNALVWIHQEIGQWPKVWKSYSSKWNYSLALPHNTHCINNLEWVTTNCIIVMLASVTQAYDGDSQQMHHSLTVALVCSLYKVYIYIFYYYYFQIKRVYWQGHSEQFNCFKATDAFLL